MSENPFVAVKSEPVAALNLQVQEFRHAATGARHYHLASQDDNNAFLVAFLTVPQDSTGVAHILEHTALCGSRNYPVRDPFFLMLRRSLNTFMNAMTASDWTAYPFASCNVKDFNNLLDVYLDAAFFPNLDPLDFAQEGHRLEFARPDDPATPLQFKGVVYNEMKGAMSAPVSRLWQSLCSQVFPTTTYHHNSGGDPRCIPDLTWQQLRDFHARHYHPSNAVFFTYGNLPAEAHQQRIHERALRHFQAEPVACKVPPEQRYETPQVVRDSYPIDAAEGLQRKTHIVFGWLLDDMTDVQAALRADFISRLLLDNSASPLLHALETSDLGDAPSPLCGLDDSSREMLFACGLEGSEAEHADALEALVLEVLGQVAEQGVPTEQAEAVLQQLELQRREIGGDRYPYGLQLIFNALPTAIHGGDAVAALDIDQALAELRRQLEKPGFIQDYVRRMLLQNRHRVRLVMTADPEQNARELAAEKARLQRERAAMDEAALRAVIEQAEALAQRQAQVDDVDLLPKVGIGDVAPELQIPEGYSEPVASTPTVWYDQPTNGLVYEQLVINLPPLPDDLLELLPLLADLLPEVGSGGRDYVATQQRQAAVTGGISASVHVGSLANDLQSALGIFTLSGKSLTRYHDQLAELLVQTLTEARFDESHRLRELVAQMRIASENSITGSGHSYAMTAASARFSPAAWIAHRWQGLAGIQHVKQLDDQLHGADLMARFMADLGRVAEQLAAAPRELVVISDAEYHAQIGVRLAQRLQAIPRPGGSGEQQFAPLTPQPVRQGWVTSSQVNFCSHAYPAPPMSHPDAPALAVLGGLLRNGYLHTAIREKGGAYGAGASYDGQGGSFRFFSYRDPRLGETLADFEASLAWLAKDDFPDRLVEEAILGVISAIDRPGSPAGDARAAYHAARYGRDAQFRRSYRKAVLRVTREQLLQSAARWLSEEQRSTAVVGSEAALVGSGLELELIHV